MTMFNLPADWLTTLSGNTASIISGILPIVLVLCGILLAIFIIRFIISLVRGGGGDDWVNPYANSPEDQAEASASNVRWLKKYYHDNDEDEPPSLEDL